MTERPYLSIGEVLGLLLEEFPDVTISKIRFLESQGLIDPERTPSGYRKFYDDDVSRLRFILREQREHFLPLKVIRDRLDESSELSTADAPTGGRGLRNVRDTDTSGPVTTRHPSAAAGPPTSVPTRDSNPSVGAVARDVTDALERPQLVSRAELVALTGVDDQIVDQLEQFGLITSRSVSHEARFDATACDIAEIAARFARLGIEVRHLRSWKMAAEREAGLFEQRVLPLLRQRNPQARADVAQLLDELVTLGHRLHDTLIGEAVRTMVEGR